MYLMHIVEARVYPLLFSLRLKPRSPHPVHLGPHTLKAFVSAIFAISETSSFVSSTSRVLARMRVGVTDFGMTVLLGWAAWKEIRMAGGSTLCFWAILTITSSVSNGDWSEPRGEYDVTIMPAFSEASTTSFWGRDLSVNNVFVDKELSRLYEAILLLTDGVRFGSQQG